MHPRGRVKASQIIEIRQACCLLGASHAKATGYSISGIVGRHLVDAAGRLGTQGCRHFAPWFSATAAGNTRPGWRKGDPENVLHFRTAWVPALYAIIQLSSSFERVSLRLSYWDIPGRREGTFLIKNGQVVEDSHSDMELTID